jgi:hypothetical protein
VELTIGKTDERKINKMKEIKSTNKQTTNMNRYSEGQDDKFWEDRKIGTGEFAINTRGLFMFVSLCLFVFSLFVYLCLFYVYLFIYSCLSYFTYLCFVFILFILFHF